MIQSLRIFMVWVSFIIPIYCIGSDPLISQELVKLLEISDVSHDGRLQSVIDAAQNSWLRPNGKERWEIEYVADPDIIDLATALGFVNEIKPRKMHYSTAAVFGGTALSFRARFGYLVQLWKEGVRFDKIVFLTGRRPLSPEKENAQILTQTDHPQLPAKKDWSFSGLLPTDETEMTLFLYEQADLPEDLRNIPYEIISVSMKGNERPTTLDTLLAMKESDKQANNVLFISSQPYCFYQHETARGVFKGVEIETVGIGLSDPYAYNSKVILDTIARWLFEASKN